MRIFDRYDLAAKCYRQALQSVKESNLGERERNIKTGEIQGLLKQLRNIVAAINDAMQVSQSVIQSARYRQARTRTEDKSTIGHLLYLKSFYSQLHS